LRDRQLHEFHRFWSADLLDLNGFHGELDCFCPKRIPALDLSSELSAFRKANFVVQIDNVADATGLIELRAESSELRTEN